MEEGCRREFRRNDELKYFYADDGLLENSDPICLQKDLNMIIDLFSKLGLKANEKKTKFMIVRGTAAPKSLSKETYDNIDRRRRCQPTSETHAERRKRKVECPICNKQIGATSLQRHMMSQHNCTERPKHVSREEDIRGNFVIDNHTKGIFNEFPVPTCTGGGKDTFGIFSHFAWKHPKASMTIC